MTPLPHFGKISSKRHLISSGTGPFSFSAK